jgi:CRP/FNR family transcriptional regulator
METRVPWHQTALFNALQPEQRQRLAHLVVVRRLPKGRVLFLEGEPCTGFYLVETGAVRLWKAGPGGEEATLAVVQGGQSFAEAAMFAGETYPVTAETLEETWAAFVPKGPFLGALRGDPDLCLQVIESQARWLRRLTVSLERVCVRGGSDRLLGWLKETAQGRASFRLPVSKKALAGQLAMSPETLSRHLRALQERGSIRVEGQTIVLL